MTCERMSPLLDDFVDGELSSAETAFVRAHLEGCERCREEESMLRTLRARAESLPRRVEPARDLWPGIEARLLAEPPAGLAAAWAPERVQWLAALAATVLVAAALVATLVTRSAGPRPAGGLGGPAAVVPAVMDVESAGMRYQAARRELDAVLAARRSQLSPDTVRAIDENLAIIDAAVAQIDAALERDPGNRDLAGLLVATWERQADALQRFSRAAGRG
jgi:anti-sigma factor RsiW